MVERKLYVKFYAALKKYGEKEQWEKFSKIADRFYKVLYNDHQNSGETNERNSLCEKMEGLILLCQLADTQKERKEFKKDSPLATITRSMEKMHEAFLNRDWDLALAHNNQAYTKGYELYLEAEEKEKKSLAQRLSFLHGYQDLIIAQQLKGNRK